MIIDTLNCEKRTDYLDRCEALLFAAGSGTGSECRLQCASDWAEEFNGDVLLE